jgi:hypothetical protein
MKYLKKFNESDAWAGSLYAYKRGINDKPNTIEVGGVVPGIKLFPFSCNDCGTDFDSLNYDEDECKACGSNNIEEISITYEDAVATASTTGMGGVSSAQPGALPGTTAEPGSGDRSTYLLSKKSKGVKKGKPSDVSDMRFLEPAKGITKVKESINQKENLNMDQVLIVNDCLVDLYHMGFKLSTLEKDFYDIGGTPFMRNGIAFKTKESETEDDIRISLHKMINVIWTGNISIRYEFDKSGITKKRVRTLRGSGSELTIDEKELTDIVDDSTRLLINMLEYNTGYFDISYLVVGSAMPYNSDRNVNLNVNIGLSR